MSYIDKINHIVEAEIEEQVKNNLWERLNDLMYEPANLDEMIAGLVNKIPEKDRQHFYDVALEIVHHGITHGAIDCKAYVPVGDDSDRPESATVEDSGYGSGFDIIDSNGATVAYMTLKDH